MNRFRVRSGRDRAVATPARPWPAAATRAQATERTRSDGAPLQHSRRELLRIRLEGKPLLPPPPDGRFECLYPLVDTAADVVVTVARRAHELDRLACQKTVAAPAGTHHEQREDWCLGRHRERERA